MQIKTWMCLFLALIVVCPGAFSQPYTGKISKNYLKIEKLIEKGRYDDALVQVKGILEDNPADLNARAYLGTIYSIQYKLDVAQEQYKKVLEKDRDNAAAHNGLGMVYYRRTASSDMKYRNKIPELLNKALEEFSLAIKSAPDFYQPYNNAGKILLELGRIGEAEKHFKKALELKPDYSEATENYGRVLFSKNRTDEAIEQYKKAIELNSKNSSAYYYLGEAYIAKGEYSEAIKHLYTSLYLFPNSAPVHNMLGKAYEMQENEAAAINEYKKAGMIKPEFTAPYLSLAEIYKNRGDEEFAIAELRNAIAVNPDFHEAQAKIAEISLGIGKIDQSIKYYKELSEIPKFKDYALKGLSRAYYLKAADAPLADIMEIENNLKQAIKHYPENLENYVALLRVSQIFQSPGESEFYLNRIIKKSKNNKIGHIMKGEAYLTVNEFGNAEKEFVKAINRTVTNDDLLKLAEIFVVNRTYSPAIIAVNRVLSRNSDNLKANRLLERIDKNKQAALSKLAIGDAFYGERQRQAAIEAYKNAININPYLEEAHLKIARAYEKEKSYNNAVKHYKAYINLVGISRDIDKYRKKVEKLERKIQE